jgi:hypothetical protein
MPQNGEPPNARMCLQQTGLALDLGAARLAAMVSVHENELGDRWLHQRTWLGCEWRRGFDMAMLLAACLL